MSVSRVRVAMAQLNLIVGDLPSNVTKLFHAAKEAETQGAHIMVAPELALVGYPPEDLLLRSSFHEQSDKALAHLLMLTAGLNIHLLIGHVSRRDNFYFNAVSILHQGRIIGTYCKHELPNEHVFDEKRYFSAGHEALIFEVQGIRLGVNICEDIWHAHPPRAAKMAGAQVLLLPNASPFHRGKFFIRQDIVKARLDDIKMPVIYVNLLGGQDELVFDGGSFAMDPSGRICQQLPQFVEQVGYVDVCLESGGLVRLVENVLSPVLSLEAQVYETLVLGVQDYVKKNKFSGAIIGLSGGVDSALTLAIAVDALGADNVRAVMMPSPYTAEISWIDARDMVKRLGVQYDEISIDSCMSAFDHSLEPVCQEPIATVVKENLQARIRGNLLMALSNQTGRIVLTTGNKSEMATGYCTLYGDMAGEFAVLKDVFKTWVYQLCAYRNGLSPVIPERIILRLPSAELRPHQVDQDSLPAYDVLDSILARYMENNESTESIIQAGYCPEDVFKTIHLLHMNEYKRRQAPVGIRVTHRAFGRDWRYPIVFNPLNMIVD